MTTVLLPQLLRSLPHRVRDEEAAELARLTSALPHLRTRRPVDLAEGRIRLEAALWQVAGRHDVHIRPRCSLLDIAHALRARGWTTGAARDALRAVVMLGATRYATSDDPRVTLAVERLIGYLELRARLG